MTITTWKDRHNAAMQHPVKFERPLHKLINALRSYREEHLKQYGSKLSDDYVLGVAWYKIAQATRDLLNGEVGRLDAGTLDTLLYQNMTAAGFTEEEIEQGL